MEDSDSFFDLVMIIANFINNTVLLVAIYVFTNKHELTRTGEDRKTKVNEWFFGKICFVKWGEIFNTKEENESTFSNGSTSLAEVSSSNMKSKLARLH